MTASPRQNRVDPFGDLVATHERGTLFGNRGVLHDDGRRIVRRFQLKRWIYCRLEFKGRRRELLQPGRYTELFFLDEATALAAGHRPCGECMRGRLNEFRAAWGDPRVPAPELDAVLHSERLTDGGEQATFAARLAELPDGVIVVAESRQPELLWGGKLLGWHTGGYVGSRPAEPAETVNVLTPRSTVTAIAAGFQPGTRCV
jgi:hypothetical protein